MISWKLFPKALYSQMCFKKTGGINLIFIKSVSFYEKEDEHHLRIVPRASAVIGLPGDMENQVGIDASHSEIYRFDLSILNDVDNYEKVQGNFRELYEGALEKQAVFTGDDGQRPCLSSQISFQRQLYYDVPNRRFNSFVGREDILSRIDKAFSTGRSPRIAVLQGMGGQGKSQVALEYCFRKRNNPYSAIFRVDSTNENAAVGSFEAIYERIKTPADHLHDSSARVAYVLQAFTSRPTSWLMVFDNYDDTNAFSNVQDFIPHGELGAILVTSRHADTNALVLEQSTNFIELPGLENDAALDLLIGQSQTTELNTKDAETIVERLGYHPLAITQAGAYIRKRKITLSRFLDEYKRRRKLVLQNTPQLSQYRKMLGSAEEETLLNVFTTWELSFQQLQSQTTRDGVETKLLTIFAFFNHKDISESFFADYVGNKSCTETAKRLDWLNKFTDDECQWDSDSFRDVLITLKDLSLLQTFASEPDGFYHSSLHPLVRVWIQLRIEEAAYQENTLVAAIMLSENIASCWQTEQFNISLLVKQSIMAHVIAQEENYETHSRLQSKVPWSPSEFCVYLTAQHWFAHFLSSMGSFKDAEIRYKRVTAEREIILGLEHPDTLTSMADLASTHWSQGRWAEAEELNAQVMETRKRVLGEEYPDTLISIGNLASTYRNQGRLTEAEKLEVQVMKTMKRVLGEEHPGTLTSMANLAHTYKLEGRNGEAIDLMKDAVDRLIRTIGAEHPDTVATAKSLARWTCN